MILWLVQLINLPQPVALSSHDPIGHAHHIVGLADGKLFLVCCGRLLALLGNSEDGPTTVANLVLI